MTWADFYLICFAGGFFFSLLSFLAGGMRWHLHLPHFSHVHVATPPVGGRTWRSGWALRRLPLRARERLARPGQSVQISPFNFITATAFLAWFGGTGYLLTRFSGVWFVTGLGLAVVSGLVGGTIVFLFLSRVLISDGRKYGPGRLRNDRRAGPSLGLDPGEWHGRNHLLAGGHAAYLRRPRSRWSRCGEGNRSDGHALREGNCLRTPLVGGVGRGRVNVGASVPARARPARTLQ